MNRMNDNPGAVKNWQQGEPHLLAETRIFDLKERHAVSPLSGREGDFVYLDSVDWINVIALTEQKQVVLIEQFRHGLGEVTLEIPGGMVDPGETPEQACLRELQEETGYTGETIEMIGRVSPNPAIQNNYCYTGLVRNVNFTGITELDTHEEIAVRLADLEEIPDLIRSGAIHHALVVCAFHHLHLLQRR